MRGNGIKLSVIVPSVNGILPRGLPCENPSVEVIVVNGVTPVSAARNAGLQKAKGDYIAWIDADDFVTEEWCPTIMPLLDKGVDVISFCARVKWMDTCRQEYVLGGVPKVEDVMSERVNGQLWNKVIRRELYAGLSFRGSTHEDYLLLCELLQQAKSFIHIDKELYVYQRGEFGISRHRNHDEGILALKGLITYSCTLPSRLKREMTKGIVQRTSDFCRNAISCRELRCYIRKNLMILFMDNRIGFKVKVKALLAAIGV